MANCSDVPATSGVFLSECTLADKIGIGFATAMCLLVMFLFGEKVHFVVTHYQTQGLSARIKSLWLLGIYPVFSFSSLLAVYIPRATLLCDLVTTVYLSICLYNFTSLIILYCVDIQELLSQTQKTGFNLRTPPCCCCCICCPIIKATRPNFFKLRLLVLQTSLLQPIIAFLSLTLWLDNKYTAGKIEAGNAYLYLSLSNSVSTLVAMYGLLIIYRSTREFLRKYSITTKLVVLQLALIFHNLQGYIFVLLARFDLPPCHGRLSTNLRSNAIQHMLLVAEMFVLSVVSSLAYRTPRALEGEGYSRIVSARSEEEETLSEGHGHRTEDGNVPGAPQKSGNGQQKLVGVAEDMVALLRPVSNDGS